MDNQEDLFTTGDQSGARRKLALGRSLSVFTMSAHLPLGQFVQLVEQAGGPYIVDTRLHRTGRHVGFAHERDVEYVLSELDFRYTYLPELAPTDGLRNALASAELNKSGTVEQRMAAWEKFLLGYINLVFRERRVLTKGHRFRQLLESSERGVVFLCACAHPEDCHRHALAGVLGQVIEGATVTHLDERLLGGKEPTRKTPRRFLAQPIPIAGIAARLPRNWRQS